MDQRLEKQRSQDGRRAIVEVRWERAHTRDDAKMSPEEKQIAMRMRQRMSSTRLERSSMERSALNWWRKMREKRKEIYAAFRYVTTFQCEVEGLVGQNDQRPPRWPTLDQSTLPRKTDAPTPL